MVWDPSLDMSLVLSKDHVELPLHLRVGAAADAQETKRSSRLILT